MPRETPRILCVQAKSLHALRETAVVCRSETATDTRGRIRRRETLRRRRHEVELPRIQNIVRRIVWILNQLLRIPRKRAGQYRFVNEIHTELEGMVAGRMAHVITELVFLLIAQRRK